MNLTRRQPFKRTAQVTAAAVVAPMVVAEAMGQEPVVPRYIARTWEPRTSGRNDNSLFCAAPTVPVDGHVNKPSYTAGKYSGRRGTLGVVIPYENINADLYGNVWGFPTA